VAFFLGVNQTPRSAHQHLLADAIRLVRIAAAAQALPEGADPQNTLVIDTTQGRAIRLT